MSILKELPELLKNDIISQETADKIIDHYHSKRGHLQNRLFIVFGILGAILTGLGIILIIAHNWDELPRTVKTIFAFLPIIVGQAFCVYTIIKKQQSPTWKESSTSFLFFAVGSGISLVSQIYHIPGNLSSLLLTWMLLCLPLAYIMRSSAASLLYILGITYYAGETGYWSTLYQTTEALIYWLLLLLILPYYVLLYKKRPKSNFMVFHNWLIPISVIFALGTIQQDSDELMFLAYSSLFGLLYLIGNFNFFIDQRPGNNGYKILGSLGTIIILLILSFDWFWEELRALNLPWKKIIISPEFIASAIISSIAITLLIIQQKNKKISDLEPVQLIFILFIVIFILGFTSTASVVLVNILIFVTGIFTIRKGAKQNHLGILNFGLFIIIALVVCRFFDTDLSFILRGLLFVIVGVGFFVTNYRMLKKRRNNE